MKNYSLEQREAFHKPYFSVNVANLSLLAPLQQQLCNLKAVKNVNISEGKRQHLTIYKQDWIDAAVAFQQIKEFLEAYDDTAAAPLPQVVAPEESTVFPVPSAFLPPKPQYMEKQEGCPTVFISYAWEGEEHRQWVLRLSNELTSSYGINVWCDLYNGGGVNLATFMTQGIRNADRVLIIGTPLYKEKSVALDNNGVSFEGMVMSSLLYQDNNTQHFIPVLKEGDFMSSFNEMMSVRVGYDLSTPEKYKANIERLARDIWNEPEVVRPKRAAKPDFGKINGESVGREDKPQWLKLVHYAELSATDFQQVYDSCWSLLESEEKIDCCILAHLVSVFAELDAKGVRLPAEGKDLLKKKITDLLNNTGNQDDLCDTYVAYMQELSRGGYDRVGNPIQDELLQCFSTTYKGLKATFPTKMALILENLTDDNVTILKNLHQTAPDHGTPYSMLTIFKGLDTDKFVISIVSLSPKGRQELASFFADRYLLLYAITAMEKAVCDDSEGLKDVQEKLNIICSKLSPIERLSYSKLESAVASAIRRCNGDKTRLVDS